jgi:hypothetical protein
VETSSPAIEFGCFALTCHTEVWVSWIQCWGVSLIRWAVRNSKSKNAVRFFLREWQACRRLEGWNFLHPSTNRTVPYGIQMRVFPLSASSDGERKCDASTVWSVAIII